MGRSSAKLRIIKHTTICLGDTIRTSGKYKDTDVSRVGIVNHIDHQNRSTFYTTKEGVELMAAHGDGTMTCGYASVTKITLINRSPDPVLF